ncbi:MAG: phage tail tape measure protein [Peptoanaerobacter stomatis]|uniref:phage tail tape measure protein n=1 Tax=Peptoanaerobacter stomatis TaxID=796937 RepID=UPI003FA06AF0
MADELQILVSAILDEQNSNTRIEAQLKALKAKLPVHATISKESINEIKKQIKELGNIDLKVNVKNNANNGLKDVEQQARNATKAVRELSDLEKAVLYNKTGFLRIKFDSQLYEVKEFQNAMMALQFSIKDLNNISVKQFNKDFATLSNILKGIDVSKPLKDIEKIKNEANKLPNKESYIKEIESVENKFNTLYLRHRDTIGTYRAMYDKELLNTANKIKSAIQDQNNETYKRNAQNFKNMVDELLRQHSRLRNSNVGSAMRELTSDESISNQASLNNAQRQFNILRSQAREMNLLSSNWKNMLLNKGKEILAYTGLASSIGFTIAKLRDMYRSILDIDTAMTSLKKVTDGTDNTYRAFFNNAIDLANKLHGKISDVVNATAEWAKLGYSIQDATKLAELNLLYKNVGDVDVVTGTRDMVSVMKAYKIETKDMITVLDKYNDVSNKYSISMAGIGEGMRRASSAMKLAGNDINDTLALLVAGNNVIQDPAVVGTFLKTASMRIRGSAGLTSAMKNMVNAEGLDMEGTLETATKVQAQINKLTNGKVDIMLNPDTFKKTYDILLEISEVWDKITDRNKAEIVEIIGGNEPHFALYVQKCA